MAPAVPTPQASDEKLMLRVQADDAEAFGQLYDRYAMLAFRVARSVCHDMGRAEEVVQEGFLSIWRARSKYRAESGSVKGWALSIVRNRAVDAVRRDASQHRSEQVELDAAMPDTRSASTVETVVARSEADALRAYMGQLPDAQAEVITLAFFGGLTHSEIAARLALPPGTVKGRMRLGLHRLRSDMAKAVGPR